jgi:AcrR family transcriptional regulator
MGRPPLNQETAREITIRLIETAQALAMRNGLESVTIRAIAAQAGLNSATLYKYFQDLDELLLFACVDMFKAYAHELQARQSERELTSPEAAYFVSWELFCRNAFTYPEFIHHLFFSRHSGHLQDVIRRYYDLFPEQMEGFSGSLQDMLRGGDLYQRNLQVLRPLLRGRAGGNSVSDRRVQLVNELTVSYFRMLLGEALAEQDRGDPEPRIARMLAACRLLTDSAVLEAQP